MSPLAALQQVARLVSRRQQEDELDPARGLFWGSLIGGLTWLLAFAGLALLMAGCAGSSHMHVFGGTGAEQEVVIQAFDDLLAVQPPPCARTGLGARIVTQGPSYARVSMTRPGNAIIPSRGTGCLLSITVNERLVKGFPADQVRAVLAHEYAHALHYDLTPARQRIPVIERER